LCPDDPDLVAAVPSSFYMLRKLAEAEEEIDNEEGYRDNFIQLFDVCPCDQYIYDDEVEHAQVCPHCAEPRTSKRQFLYVDITQRIRLLYAQPKFRPHFRY
jgi:hypothetical protein